MFGQYDQVTGAMLPFFHWCTIKVVENLVNLFAPW